VTVAGNNCRFFYEGIKECEKCCLSPTKLTSIVRREKKRDKKVLSRNVEKYKKKDKEKSIAHRTTAGTVFRSFWKLSWLKTGLVSRAVLVHSRLHDQHPCSTTCCFRQQRITLRSPCQLKPCWWPFLSSSPVAVSYVLTPTIQNPSSGCPRYHREP
jgi:hypothetical protein